MPSEIIEKNIERLKTLLNELEGYLDIPFEKFKEDAMRISATERKFQLMVDIASDINTQTLISKGAETPDTYRRSFLDLSRIGILPHDLAKKLAESASVRNILVHEYDFEEDYEKFYHSAKESLPAYKNYIKIILKQIKN